MVATLCLLLLFSLTACGKDPVYLDEERSWFNDYSISGETVIFRCYLTIENSTSSPQTVSVTGHFREDMKSGMIKEEYLIASDFEDPECTTFLLEPGTNSFDVVFIGTANGYPMKQNRLLPEISIEIH